MRTPFILALSISIPAHAAGPLPVACTPNCATPAGSVQFQGYGNVKATTSGNTMTVNQSSPTAILNWQSFNIDKGYTVNFVQPSSTSSALNRIWDGNPTTIAGQLNANGQIYLVNQNGIVFANGAQVNVDTLIASSLDITDSLYKAGYLTANINLPNQSGLQAAFFGSTGFVKVDTGAVINGSRIMMFAPIVENSGSITTADGQVVLAAGTRVYLEASQDPNLRGVLVEVNTNKLDSSGRMYYQDSKDPSIQLLTDGKGNFFDLNGNALTQDINGHLISSQTGFVLDSQGNQVVANDFTVPVLVGGNAVSNPKIDPATGKSYVQNNAVGTVTNFGSILSQRGNTTVVGYAVNQQGIVSATTSVNENGSIKLLARHEVASTLPNDRKTITINQSQSQSGSVSFDIRATQTGSVTLSKNSVTQVTPETSDTSTTTDSQGFNPSIVEVMGKTVDVQGSIIAPGGKVNLVATGSIDPTVGQTDQSGSGIYREINSKLSYSSFLNPSYVPVVPSTPDGSSVILENGSLVDVSGSMASVSVARDILSVQLMGTQLADSPLQRNGILHGQTVYIDIRKGAVLANYSGEEAQIGRTAAERTSAGGQVSIVSTGKAILNSGSTVNISGGQVNYTGSLIHTTTLLSNGVAYDISNAPNNLVYDGMGGMVTVNHAKWGVTESWAASGSAGLIWDPGYVQGMSAGSLTVVAPNAAIGSKIVSNTVSGIFQRQPYVDPATLAVNNYKNTWQMLPKGGSIAIGEANPVKDASNNYQFVTNNDVVVQPNTAQVNYAAGDALPSTITLDSGIFSSGVNNLSIYTNGRAEIASGISLNLAPGGSVILKGGEADMLGSINAPGGSVAFGTLQTGRFSTGGAVNVSGSVSTRGTWVNDSNASGTPDLSIPIIENGGSISIKSNTDVNIASGVTLDASGGGYVDQPGKIHGGSGGNISISSGNPGGTSTTSYQVKMDGATLQSYGADTGKGGSLAISGGDIQIGGNAAAGTLLLSPSFFQAGGFTNYSITAQGFNGLTVAGNTSVLPKSQSLILTPSDALQPSGTDVYAISSRGFLPDWQINPASITLAQNQANLGALVVGSGSTIQVDPRASITLNSTNQLTVLGTLEALAGNINLNLNLNNAPYSGKQSIWLGSQSRLLAGGYFLQSAPNPIGLVQGQALSGGNINIASGGFFVANKGSVMDVSGTSANIDLPQAVSGSIVYRTTHVAGDAGSISASAVDGAIFDGTMTGSAEAGSQAAGGRFSLYLNGKGFTGSYDTTIPSAAALLNGTSWKLFLDTSGAGSFAAKAGLTPGNDSAAGNASLQSIEGQAYIDQGSLAGFDQVSLKSYNSISLADNVSLSTRRSITLDTPLLNVGANTNNILNYGLNSAHVTIGNLDMGNQSSVSPTTGTGSLNVAAQLVDISGNVSIGNVFTGVDANGNGSVNLSSSGDIRLNGILDVTATPYNTQSLQGALRTQGNITLKANQVYASTLAQFTISSEAKDISGNPTGTITILSNDRANPSSGNSPVLSAGGSLTLSANQIFQGGVLKAPMGMLDLKGASSVVLEQGSLTSVSSEGQTVPFGYIQGGNAWYYDLAGNGQYVAITAPPQKKIKLEGPNVQVVKSTNAADCSVSTNCATVDLSGGGNLLATEFFAGIGGTKNVLDPTQAPTNTYAIIPGISGYTPYDSQTAGQYAQSGSKTVLGNDRMVYLSGGNGLAAGYYSLLPASYALLPGAYRVTAVSGYQDLQSGLGPIALSDGSQVMAGKFAVAGTNIMDARWSGFAVSPGAVVRAQSEFHDSTANAFFAAQAAAAAISTPALPVDAGQLIVNASGTGAALTLDGKFETAAGAGGQGATVDFNGSKFDIYDPASRSVLTGYVPLTTTTLGNLAGFQSLLIGGTRTRTSNGETVSVGASDVIVDGASIAGPEILLAANNTVTVNSGSSIQGSGSYSGQPQNIDINGNGALLRVSSGQQVTVSRTNVDPTKKAETLTIQSGASISSSNSILLDSTYSTILNSTSLTGKAFSVSASAIDIGSGGASSLALAPALLSNFQDITLHSYGDINFYGNAGIGTQDAPGKYGIATLTLNAQSLNGNNGTSNAVLASTVTLTNNNGSFAKAAVTGSGTLRVKADNIVLSSGTSTLQGFDTVALDAAQNITGQGTGSLNVSSGNGATHTLALSGTITGAAKSDQAISAAGYDIAIKPAAGTPVANANVGAKFAITGNSLTDSGTMALASGTVTLHAANTLTLDSGSNTSVAGFTKSISGQTTYAPAGTIRLVSDNGNVNVNGTVDVSGASGGGDAGSLNVSAVKGTVSLTGNLKGSAANAQGSFKLDAGSVASLDSLNAILNSGGYTGALDLRIRSGDVVLGAGSTVKASSYHLSADAGKIDLSGTINASGSSGGDILLSAANDVTLQSTAQLNASAASSGGNGGKVSLETVNGAVNLNNAKAIDVSGAKQGSVLLRAPQINNGTDVAVNGKVNVSSGASVTVEGYKNYAASTIGSADVGTSSVYYSDAQLFVGNAAAIASRLGMSGAGMQVLPGIQITSSGDLTLSSNWDLSTWRFAENGVNVPGILTLKAGGNLNFGSGTTTASLSDGFTSATSSTLTNDSSWSYRLVAGSDSSAANVMAVNDMTGSGSGNVILVPGTEKTKLGKINYTFEMIRTGTGSIDIAAGGGLYLGNRDSMIYTAGQQSSGIPSNVGASSTKVFPTGGGDVSIAVKGDINAAYGNGTTPGTAVNQLITDWLWRQGSTDGSFATPPAWWINFATFAQGIGALGGGNVNISAGGNIESLSASVPTTGYVAAADASPTYLGGGNLTVKAGGNIDSGIFYVGSGKGAIEAGGSLGASRFDQINNNAPLYTILALQQGNIDVKTGGDLNLQTVLNPTVVAQGVSQGASNAASNFFFSYGNSSGVSLASLNGNVILSNNSNVFANPVFFNLKNPHNGGDLGATLVYPYNLQAIAINGGLTVNSFTLLPSTNGNLTLFAGSNISFYGQSSMSDAYPGSFQANSPFAQYSDALLLGHGTASSNSIVPLHSGDSALVSIAAGGSIYGDNSSPVNPNLSLPKAATIAAGQDIVNLSASIQNQTSSDTTSFVAGRDIVFIPNPALPTSSLPGITVYGPGQLVVQGGRNVNLGQSNGLQTEGNLLNPYLPAQGASITVLAGVGSNAAGTQSFISKYIAPATGNKYTQDLASYVSSNVDPASSVGKDNIPYLVSYFFDPSTTTGQANTATLDNFVTSHGATAGLKPADAYSYLKSLPSTTQAGFAYDFFKAQSPQVQSAYVASDSMQMNAPDLISFVNNHGGNAGNVADAYTAFQGMSSDLRNAFANQVFFNLLRTSGRSAIGSGNYSAGYDAISALFPGKYQGDLSLYYSQIKTVKGGDINILAPGGGVNAGLANTSPNDPKKPASELGVVTVGGGAVNAFVNNDFLVNQSRVFTLQGGNIMMWSSNGNLDAGKGSKSVSSTPPPILVVDPKTGTFTVDVTQSVVGSGIRVLLANKNVVPGSVDLFAPSGVINAGDAGIGSAGNIYLGALQVIGANNIDFGGVAVGVPVTTTASFGGLAGIGNFQGAAQAANQATQSLGNQADNSAIQQALANFKPLFLSVDVIGLGNQVFGP